MTLEVIDSFIGKNFFLSNFYEHPVFGLGSTEAWYQMMKTTVPEERALFTVDMKPGAAKRLGNSRSKITLRENWESIKDWVMYSALTQKFVYEVGSSGLDEMLLDTGDAILVEGNNWHDNYWGDCTCWKTAEDDPMKAYHTKCIYPGKNMLGTQLMMLRASMRMG